MRFRSIVILTGAGISAESGLGTFRDRDGLWTKYDLNDVATPEGFARNPVLVHDFYNARRQNLIEAVPNAAHAALAGLERGWDGDFLLVTQNVDDLHERAGSEKVLHMHGELLKVRCGTCGSIAVHRDSLDPDSRCGACCTAGRMRPPRWVVRVMGIGPDPEASVEGTTDLLDQACGGARGRRRRRRRLNRRASGAMAGPRRPRASGPAGRAGGVVAAMAVHSAQ